MSAASTLVPGPNGLVAYSDATFGQEVFDEWSGTPAMAEVESVVEPDRGADDLGGSLWRL
jgi:hypothetical protein